MKPFLYIVQASKEQATCKIGITDDLDRRLKEYNSATGHSKDNAFEYLYTCEVKNAEQIENSRGLPVQYGKYLTALSCATAWGALLWQWL